MVIGLVNARIDAAMAKIMLLNATTTLNQCSEMLIGGQYCLIPHHNNQSTADAESGKAIFRFTVVTFLSSSSNLLLILSIRKQTLVAARRVIKNISIHYFF
jgi:hypothetical protein